MYESVLSVLVEAERRREEVAELCSELVKIPSVNPPGFTREVVDYIMHYFSGAGLESEVFERESGKPNIRVRLNGNRPGKILWLGHIDVVPEGDRSLWSHDPFSGELVSGRIYGRGASDMKGSCASAMVAARILGSLDPNEFCTAEFWFTCDEETGATNGVKWLSESGVLGGDVCVIGDSMGDLPDNPGIDVGCKGAIRPALRVKGVAAHGSQPFMGENAIEKLITVAEAVKRVEEMRLELPEALGPVVKSTLDDFERSSVLSADQVARLQRVFHYPTASLNMISGGVKVNVVPDRAEAMLDIRVSPGTSIDLVKKRVLSLVESSGVNGVEVEFRYCKEGYYEDPDSWAVKEFAKAVKEATGKKPVLKLLMGGTDAVFLKSSVDIPCLGFGVGVKGKAHVHDEYTTVENLVIGTKVYAVLPMLFDVGGRERA